MIDPRILVETPKKARYFWNFTRNVESQPHSMNSRGIILGWIDWLHFLVNFSPEKKNVEYKPVFKSSKRCNHLKIQSLCKLNVLPYATGFVYVIAFADELQGIVMFSSELLPSCFDEIQEHSNYKLDTGFMDGKLLNFHPSAFGTSFLILGVHWRPLSVKKWSFEAPKINGRRYTWVSRGETPHFGTLLLGGPNSPHVSTGVWSYTRSLLTTLVCYVDLSDNKTEAVGFTHTADLYTPLDGNRWGPPKMGGREFWHPRHCFCFFVETPNG